MKFSSFLIFTAAGLAIAAPITPISPSNVEKKLTVEPDAVYKRQIPDTKAVTALTKGLPVATPIKRQLDMVTGLIAGADKGEKDVEPKEPKLPSSVDEDEGEDLEDSTEDVTEPATNATAPATDDATSALGGLPVKRQSQSKTSFSSVPEDVDAEDATAAVPATDDATSALSGLGLPIKREETTDDAAVAEEEEESVDPTDLDDVAEPKEPELPSSVDDDVEKSDDDDEEKKSATSKIPIGGLPIGKRQTLPDLNALLGMKTPPPAPATPANATAPAADTTEAAAETSAADAAATPAAAAGGLGGLGLKARQLNGLLGGEKAKPAPIANDASNKTAAAAPAAEPAAGALGGILKRQLDGLLGGLSPKKDPAATPAPAADADADSNSQVSKVDDGTNTAETSFSGEDIKGADEEETADEKKEVEAAPAKNATEPAAATPAPTTPAAKPAGGLAGLLGM